LCKILVNRLVQYLRCHKVYIEVVKLTRTAASALINVVALRRARLYLDGWPSISG